MNYRHRNGRGWLLDHAEANRAAYISIDSVAQGNARVKDARLFNGSIVDEEAQVYGGTLVGAYVGGRTIVAGAPLLGEKTIARCKAISGRPRIFNSRLEDLVEVGDEPFIRDVHLHEGVTVYGNARLTGPWTLGGFARIHEGEWRRAPLTVKLAHACLTECVEGKILIECNCRTREYWLKHGPKHGRREGWTEAQIEETLQAIKELRV